MKISDYFISERVSEVDKDFLSYEQDMLSKQDQERLLKLLGHGYHKMPNPNNSILLYVCGLTEAFDKDKARSESIGGSPPDKLN